jgi:hypothetical protein
MARKIFKSQPMKIKAAICLLVAAFTSASCSGGARGVPAVERNSQASPSQPENGNAAKVQLGGFQELAGTDYLMAPVATPRGREDYSVKPEGSRADFARNYLFVNLTDKSSYLLLPTNDYLILEAKVLPAGGQAKENKENKAAPQTEPAKADNRPAKTDTKWLYYRVVKSDTDNDKQLTGSDRWTVALSDISGREYKELIADVETILYETNRADNLILIYRAEGRNQIAEINLSTRQVTLTKDLQEIQPK